MIPLEIAKIIGRVSCIIIPLPEENNYDDVKNLLLNHFNLGPGKLIKRKFLSKIRGYF